MQNFASPNPYGSYFEFGQPESAAMSAFLPSSSGNLSPHALTMMGRMPGGFNPSTLEYAMQRNREMANSQFMAHVLRSDARAAMLGDRALDAMIPDAATRSAFVKRMGGYGSINEVTSFLLNLPAVSGHLGGSHMSLGIGAMSLATGNMSMNGYNYFGGNWAQNEAAKAIFNTINNRFYGPAGASNLSATQGLNRDQIGGIMTLAAAQGAFAGMDLGKLSATGGGMSFTANQGTMNKIASFTKSAAKALSGLIDIYGDQSVGELLQKAQSITGLNFGKFGNAEAIGQRLQNLRTAANNYGYDPQTVMDLAAGATGMGQALGARQSFAGAIAQHAVIQALPTARQMQANAGVFFMNTPGVNEVTSAIVRDQLALSRDPLGARRAAVELMLQQGMLPGSDAAGIRNRLESARPSDLGMVDRMVRDRTGISLSSYIRSMGGPDAVAGSLDEAGRGNLLRMNEADMQRRMDWNIRRMSRRVLGPASASNEALLEMNRDLSVRTMEDLLSTSDEGARARVLENDLVGMHNPKRYLSLARQAGPGGLGNYRALRTAINNNPLTSRWRSRADLEQNAAEGLRNVPAFDNEMRGQLRGGLVEGLLSRLGGQDPRSAFALLWQLNADELKKKGYISRIAGSGADEEMILDRGAYFDGTVLRDPRGAAKLLNNMRRSIGRLPGGNAALEALIPGFTTTKDFGAMLHTERDRDVLRVITEQALNPANLSRAFSGFGMYKLGASTTFMSPQDFTTYKAHGPEIATLAAAATALQKAGAPAALYEGMRTAGRIISESSDLTDEQRARHAEIGMRGLKTWQSMRYLSPDTLKKLTDADPKTRQELVNILTNEDARATVPWWMPDALSDKAKIRKRLEALGGGPTNDVVMKLQGTFRVVDKNTIELMNGTATQSANKTK